jgi:hypothetical protein
MRLARHERQDCCQTWHVAVLHQDQGPTLRSRREPAVQIGHPTTCSVSATHDILPEPTSPGICSPTPPARSVRSTGEAQLVEVQAQPTALRRQLISRPACVPDEDRTHHRTGSTSPKSAAARVARHHPDARGQPPLQEPARHRPVRRHADRAPQRGHPGFPRASSAGACTPCPRAQDLVTESNWQGHPYLQSLVTSQLSRIGHGPRCCAILRVTGDNPFARPQRLAAYRPRHPRTGRQCGASTARSPPKAGPAMSGSMPTSRRTPTLGGRQDLDHRMAGDRHRCRQGAGRPRAFGTLVLERIVPLSVGGSAELQQSPPTALRYRLRRAGRSVRAL